MQTLSLPTNHLHKKEQQTIDVIKALKAKGFVEGAYEKPFRVFTKGKHVVKININGAVILHNRTDFRGANYGKSVEYFQNLNVS